MSALAVVSRPPDHEGDDLALVAGVRAGNDRAFEALYVRYQARITAYVRGMVQDHGRAEDITQEVFMSALRRMRETRAEIVFKPWIYEIAKNACIDAWRRSRRTNEVSIDAQDALGADDHGRLAGPAVTPHSAIDAKFAFDNLCGAFGGLSQTHHEILVMREFEGLSYREIGERLGMSRPSVESTLFRARRRLTEEYDELVSGQRCVRVQGIIAGASGGGLGARDRRRMARHLSYCQPCRRHAYSAGLGDVVPAKTGVGAKIAAWLPMPFFLQKRLLGLGGTGGAGDGSHHAGALAHWSASASQFEPAAAGWTKAVATAATIAVAGVGAGAVTSQNNGGARAVGPAGLGSLGDDSTTSAAPVAAGPGAGRAATVAS